MVSLQQMGWFRSTFVAEGIRAGSEELEAEFAGRFLLRLRAFFRARTSNPDWVEELTQETLMAALIVLRAGGLRESGAMESFVLGIAHKRLAEACRQKARAGNLQGTEEVETVGAGRGLGPEWTLTIRRELESLEEVNRQILWKILVEGYRPAEVAAQVGLSEEAVRQRKSRTLRRLAVKFGIGSVTTPEVAATPKVVSGSRGEE